MKIGERQLTKEELQRVRVRVQVETLLDNEVIDSAVKDGDQVYICLGDSNGKVDEMVMHQTMVCNEMFLVATVDTLFQENPGVLFGLMEKVQVKMCKHCLRGPKQQENEVVQ